MEGVDKEIAFDITNEVEFEVKDRSFGELSPGMSGVTMRMNYFSVQEKGTDEQIGIRVTKEVYEDYQIGDTIKMYVDDRYREKMYMYGSQTIEIID